MRRCPSGVYRTRPMTEHVMFVVFTRRSPDARRDQRVEIGGTNLAGRSDKSDNNVRLKV